MEIFQTEGGLLMVVAIANILFGFAAALFLALYVQERRERKKAEHDALRDPRLRSVRIGNMRLLRWAWDVAMARLSRGEIRIALLCLADIDGLKKINDLKGHAMGNRAMEDVAERLVKAVRASDTVANIGGDEFAVLITGSSIEMVGELVERMRRASSPTGTEPYHTSFSVGVASTEAATDLESLLAKADSALYREKDKKK